MAETKTGFGLVLPVMDVVCARLLHLVPGRTGRVPPYKARVSNADSNNPSPFLVTRFCSLTGQGTEGAALAKARPPFLRGASCWRLLVSAAYGRVRVAFPEAVTL